jgi:hypothetical protein
MITNLAVKYATLWALPYWKQKWSGAEDYMHFRECLVLPSEEIKARSHTEGYIKRGQCGRCRENLDVWCPDCREKVRFIRYE